MPEWAQHWETVNGSVITAVYTGFCVSNLDIHKSLFRATLFPWKPRDIKWSTVGRDCSNCGTIGGALWKWSERHLLVFRAVTLAESCCFTYFVWGSVLLTRLNQFKTCLEHLYHVLANCVHKLLTFCVEIPNVSLLSVRVSLHTSFLPFWTFCVCSIAVAVIFA